MAASKSQDISILVAEMENLKTKFASLELENQRLLGGSACSLARAAHEGNKSLLWRSNNNKRSLRIGFNN